MELRRPASQCLVSAVAMITSHAPSKAALPAKQRPDTMPIIVGWVNRHGWQTKLSRGAKHANGNLAAIGDEQLSIDHGVVNSFV